MLASQTSIALGSSAFVSMVGGVGGDSVDTSGAGGGGGGGIAHFIAPTLVDVGSMASKVFVTGGAAGSGSTSVNATPRMAGGAGGSCGGGGGSGASVTTGNVSDGATAGGSGFFFTTQADPTGLM